MSDTPRIYLDNAATSWPKPPVVYQAVDHYQRVLGAPAGRSAYREASQVERLVAQARQRVARLIGADDPARVIFTLNATDSLNLALHGLLRPGDHVVTSVVEHNSVLRPLRYLEERGQVAVTRVVCDGTGLVDPDEIRAAIQPRTQLIALIHASNVTGAMQPVAEVGRIAAQRQLLFLLDAAQTLGSVPFDVGQVGAHLVAAPGHKGLLGPLGTGILYLAAGVEPRLEPRRQGGTGTISQSDRQPDSLPDRYESGSPNVPGIVGLNAGLGYLSERGIEAIERHHRELTTRLLDGLRAIEGVTLYGPPSDAPRVAVVSFNLAGYAPQEVATMLDAAYQIQVRAGIHCAPRMHDALATTHRGGTVRLSLGPFNTQDEIDATVRAVGEIASAAIEA